MMSPYSYSTPFFFVGGLIIFYIIFVVIFYLFSSLGLYTMAKRRGLENPWLAWIPVASIYVIGKLADTYAARHMNKKTNYAALLLGLIVGAVVLNIITQIMSFARILNSYSYSYNLLPLYLLVTILTVAVTIVYIVFYYISLYRIYNWHSSSASTLLVLSIFFSVIVPFVFFALRNGDNPNLYPPQPPAAGYQQPQQQYMPQQPYQGGQNAPPQQPPQQPAPGQTTQPPQDFNSGGSGNI